MSALDELIRTDKRDAAFYADDKQLELIDYAANELAQLRNDIEDALNILRAFSQHDDYIGRKTVMQAADDFIATHQPTAPKTSPVEHCRCSEVAEILIMGTSPTCPACGMTRKQSVTA